MEQPTEPKLDSIAWQIDAALDDKNSDHQQPTTTNAIGTEGTGSVDDGAAGLSTTLQRQQHSASEMSHGRKHGKGMIIPPVAF